MCWMVRKVERGWESGFKELLEQVIGENHHAEGWEGDVKRVRGVEGDVGGPLGYGSRLGMV